MSEPNAKITRELKLSITVEFGPDATESMITVIREDLLDRLSRANMSVLRKSSSSTVVSRVTTLVEVEE